MLSELYETDQGIPERRGARSILLRVRDRDHGTETFGRRAVLESGVPHSILKRNSNVRKRQPRNVNQSRYVSDRIRICNGRKTATSSGERSLALADKFFQ